MDFFVIVSTTFFACYIAVPILLAMARATALYMVVRERQVVVYEVFGKVRLELHEPGLHWPLLRIGPMAVLVPLFGKRYVVDTRLDQNYLRSQPVNSEEGAPMGVGVWYEMMVTNPTAYLYRNTDPSGSLRANVSNAIVRCLSNMKLSDMLENRHQMSGAVREEVSPKSQEWGYSVGSVYVRKVHFRDVGMISQIEQKVVNRLRQVTAAIQQDGSNRVNVIRSAAEREAAIEFAKAEAVRPQIVGRSLSQIAMEPTISEALFEVLEIQNMLQSERLEVTVLPLGSSVMNMLGR